jgi:hypothetical protein
MLKYAKKKGGSKSKRKGSPNTGHPTAKWRRCNPAYLATVQLQGEFKSPKTPRAYSTGGKQHRGHVCIPNCDCLSRKDWYDNYSEEYIAMVAAEKQRLSRVQAHEENGPVCGVCFTLMPVSGAHDCS